jgi:hypothetical protein
VEEGLNPGFKVVWLSGMLHSSLKEQQENICVGVATK